MVQQLIGLVFTQPTRDFSRNRQLIAIEKNVHRFRRVSVKQLILSVRFLTGRILLLLARERQRLPCAKGKRSAVAVVNDSPVGCQSRDRAHRSEQSRKQRD